MEAIVRIYRILPAGTTPGFDSAALVDDAEKALAEAIADRKLCESVSGFATSAKDLVDPIARFFNDTLVMAKEPGLRTAHLPTLVASVYGTNFQHMSELDWKYGYAWGILLMVASAALPMNGLRQAGAEAVAINGHRITTLTPIRSAGSAITVDYVSLNPPYVVEAIGDPSRLQARFVRTSAAVWWQYLHDNYGIAYELQTVNGDLRLPADPAMTLRYAES